MQAINPKLWTAGFIACMVVVAASGSILSNTQSGEQIQALKKPKIAPHWRNESKDVNFQKIDVFSNCTCGLQNK